MIGEELGTLGSALLTLSLVAIAVVISLYQRLDLEKDIGIAVVRSFVQLTAIGFVISFIFSLKDLAYVVLLLVGMVLFASWTSARRGEGITGAFTVSAVGIGIAAAATLGVLLTLQIVPPPPAT